MHTESPTIRPAHPADLAALASPLDEFYRAAGLALPELRRIPAREVPEPFDRLLVHRNDMTPTLEEFYRKRLHLRVLGRRHTSSEYCREVVLFLDETGEPVEFGASRIVLDRFPAAARQAMFAERELMGHIMRDFAVTHTCAPNAFLRLTADRLISEKLEVPESEVLYGRHNRLFDAAGQLISEVMEILRPPGTRRRC